MPRKAMQVCPTPGCPTLTASGRCADCQAAARSARPSSHSHGYNTAWQRASARYLEDHPYCECPECSALPPLQRDLATEVDHIDGLGPLGPRGYDPANWQAMSKPHHSRKTAAETWGI
ncbi:HNH endonuclease signature motif containing protein [Streptomyces sp. NPDC058614]|uniref:HNH endonuclease signature motif containing protein n=1 Tax=Streptomyces sp. NPDC058614 TaxID=3346557 RepID=UPI00365F52DE